MREDLAKLTREPFCVCPIFCLNSLSHHSFSPGDNDSDCESDRNSGSGRGSLSKTGSFGRAASSGEFHLWFVFECSSIDVKYRVRSVEVYNN